MSHDQPQVVWRAENYRVVRHAREAPYNEREFVLESKQGEDAMGVERWDAVDFAENPAHALWLVKQLGVFHDDRLKDETSAN